MDRRMLLTAGLVILLGSPANGWTQDASIAHYRQGFWIGFGLGPAHAQIDCSGCGPLPSGDPWHGGSGTSGYIALGGTPRPNLLVGGEINGYGRATESPEREALVGNVALTAQYYPLTDRRVFLKSGAGIGQYRLAYYTAGWFGKRSIEHAVEVRGICSASWFRK